MAVAESARSCGKGRQMAQLTADIVWLGIIGDRPRFMKGFYPTYAATSVVPAVLQRPSNIAPIIGSSFSGFVGGSTSFVTPPFDNKVLP